jgi:deoxycytidylate deaminase
MSASLKQPHHLLAGSPEPEPISQLSRELVIGLVGYAGAGCSTAASRIELLLDDAGYKVHRIKLSDLIRAAAAVDGVTPVSPGLRQGMESFARGGVLQNAGDSLRESHGHRAVAALAIRDVRAQRGTVEPGQQKLAFLLDSLKHPEEVQLLRRVYDSSFRLVAVHCERTRRERRLIGDRRSVAKFKGVPAADVKLFMDRDEEDANQPHGQHVRETFHIADFFLNNNTDSGGGESLTADIERFLNLLLGTGIVRPTRGERAMYHAYAAALQSSCLSRQVGAALVDPEDGTVLSTGTNDVPMAGGGVYDEESKPDHRCFAWEWSRDGITFKGCHNHRKKRQLREDIAKWFADSLSDQLALAAHPKPASGMDTADAARALAREDIRTLLLSSSALFDRMPGIKGLIEYSRSIHAEMNALLAAGRSGVPAVGTALYCTTYPCHNCARHLVAAGVANVFYIEPYVKSLASELHYDAIATELPQPEAAEVGRDDKMTITPFTGVGPRMYEDLFTKRSELKTITGAYDPPVGGLPAFAVRLDALARVEEAAAALVPMPSGG